MSTDKIADLLTRIRNAYLARRQQVALPHSRLKEEIVKIMVAEKYLDSYQIQKDQRGFPQLIINLKYLNGQPALHQIKRVSKPGLRVYTSAHRLTPVLSGYGIAIISTSRGLMTNKAAKKQNLGGEVLCELW